jgi:hypothetical protein
MNLGSAKFDVVSAAAEALRSRLQQSFELHAEALGAKCVDSDKPLKW